jgi:hypothetical protein
MCPTMACQKRARATSALVGCPFCSSIHNSPTAVTVNKIQSFLDSVSTCNEASKNVNVSIIKNASIKHKFNVKKTHIEHVAAARRWH